MRPVIGITYSTEDLSKIASGTPIRQEYVEAIENAGGTALIWPLTPEDSCLTDYFGEIDGLLLSGGGDVDPAFYGEEILPVMGKIDISRDRIEISLTRKALESNMPILGICRGVQVLNVAAGGTLYQDVSLSPNTVMKHSQKGQGEPATHILDVKEGSLLTKIVGQSTLPVNSFHHQSVKKAAPGFMVSAVARDEIIEAIESNRHNFVIGVQFHPERIWQNNPPISNIFAAFVAEAGKYKQGRKTASMG